MALSNAARRAIAIRSSIARKAKTAAPTPANDTAPKARTNPVLAACIAAGGFEQHAAY